MINWRVLLFVFLEHKAVETCQSCYTESIEMFL